MVLVCLLGLLPADKSEITYCQQVKLLNDCILILQNRSKHFLMIYYANAVTSGNK